MKNVSSGCLLFFLLVGCQTPWDQGKTGSLKVTVIDTVGVSDPTTYFQTYLSNAPTATSYGLVTVSPAIGGKTLFPGNLQGVVNLPSVPAGTYSVWPTFFPGKGQTVEVQAGQTTTVSLTFHLYAGVQFLYLNTADTTVPLSDLSVRKALAAGLDREAIRAGAVGTKEVLACLLPVPGYQTSPPAGLNLLAAGDGKPSAVLAGKTIDFLTNLNASGEYAALSSHVVAGFTALGLAASATTASSGPAKTALMGAGTFTAARGGWAPDGTNDLLPSLVQWFGSASAYDWSRVGAQGVDTLLDQTAAALASGDSAAYEAQVFAVNNAVLNLAAVIPLYGGQ